MSLRRKPAFRPSNPNSQSEAFGLAVRSERTGSPTGRTKLISSYPESLAAVRAVVASWTCA